MGLSVREQELVILRMGVLYGSEYVWKHHVPLGVEFGMTEAEFDDVRAGRFEGAFSAREHALLALTDELVEARTIRRELWDRFHGSLAERDLVDLVHLVSQYVLFALMNNAMQVQLEPALDAVPGIQPS
jgi:4-carboxymuconolactone decarboxylase